MRRRPAHDVLRAHHAGLTGDLPPTLKQGERRDAADTELRGQVGLSLGIHLRQPDRRFELVRRLLELWRHHLARLAPLGPEVDDDEARIIEHLGLEVIFRQRDDIGERARLDVRLVEAAATAAAATLIFTILWIMTGVRAIRAPTVTSDKCTTSFFSFVSCLL